MLLQAEQLFLRCKLLHGRCDHSGELCNLSFQADGELSLDLKAMLCNKLSDFRIHTLEANNRHLLRLPLPRFTVKKCAHLPKQLLNSALTTDETATLGEQVPLFLCDVGWFSHVVCR